MKKKSMLKFRLYKVLSEAGKLLLPLIFLFVGTGFGYSQKKVTGTVTGSDGLPMPGVSVVVKGTTTGASTDIDGKYSLNVPADAKTLVFTFMGMESQEVAIGISNNYDVVLAQSLVGLDEVVVVGYGEQSRSKLTTSISKLDTKVLANAVMANPGAALQGTIAGLRVINTTGQPGSLPSILLRGGASITSPGSPLVVVDGVVRSLSDVNPADIESLQVLKDAASTAIYGARANNGVILITTKRGKSGVSEVTYTMKAGINALRESYNYLNARDYVFYNRRGVLWSNQTRRPGNMADYNVEAYGGYGTINPQIYDLAKITGANRANFQTLVNDGWQWMMDPYSEKDTIMFRDYSGQVSDAGFNKNARTMDHNLSFTGGNDKGKFAASINSYEEQGLVVGTKYQRISGSFNGSYKVKNNLEVFTGATYSQSKRPAFLPGDIFFRTQSMQPTYKPFDDNGNPTSSSNMSYGNPLYYLDKNVRHDGTRRTVFNIGANWEILPDLFLRGKASIYYTDVVEENFTKKIVYQTGSVDINRPSSASYSKSYQQQHNITLDYKKSFNQHNLSFLVGGEYFDVTSWSLSAAGKSAPTDEIYTLNAAVERTSISSGLSQYRMLSGFSRFNYDYKDKYLLSAVMRYDGVSSLSDNRWGAFPGISVGWNLHQEDFFRSSSLSNYISTLKPRISYGVNGNIAGIGNYEVQGAYGIQTFYNLQAGYLNTGIINNGLRWEKSKSFDGGVEIGLLKNKINLNLTYFRRTTSDLLTNLALPDYTGFSSFRTNLGNLQNTGFESEVSFNILKLENGLTWDFGFNTSFVRNKILKLPYNGNDKNRQGGSQVYDQKSGKVIWVGGYQEGEEYGEVYAYKQERILRDWDDVNQTVPNRYDAVALLYGPEAYARLANKTGKFPIMPGDVLWADLDNNDTINMLDRVRMGNIYPKWTGGFSTNISYKGFSLYGRFDFGAGHIIYNDLTARIMGQYVGTMNIIDWAYDTWSPDNPDAKYPRFLFADYPSLNIKRTDWNTSDQDLWANSKNSVFYEKGDYLAVREITLSYLLPKSLVSKLKINSIQVYLTGQNLAYFTKEYTGTSPEQGGVDIGKYPLPRNYILGLQVSF